MSHGDGADGSFRSNNDTYEWFHCSKTDIIYLSGGLHVVDVVAKGDGVEISGGFLTVELTQYEDGADINIPAVNLPASI
ncbi:hypothetical protein I4U23_027437 [Adineta vaga]|nr:hypothetical protein I4U23_027437 [Adineta vaga]